MMTIINDTELNILYNVVVNGKVKVTNECEYHQKVQTGDNVCINKRCLFVNSNKFLERILLFLFSFDIIFGNCMADGLPILINYEFINEEEENFVVYLSNIITVKEKWIRQWNVNCTTQIVFVLSLLLFVGAIIFLVLLRNIGLVLSASFFLFVMVIFFLILKAALNKKNKISSALVRLLNKTGDGSMS